MISEVARRYARALYDHAKGQGKADAVFMELRTLSQAINSEKSILDFTTSPLVAPDQKMAALKNALAGKVSDSVLSFLLLLAEKNRLSIFSEMVGAYESINDDDHGVKRGTVTSAKPLTPEAQKSIEDAVHKTTKKKVILTYKEDPKLLGGTIAQVGGWTFDDSLETHLMRMSEDLNRRSH